MLALRPPLAFAAVAALAAGILYWAVWQNGPVFGGVRAPDYISEFTTSLAAGHLYLPQAPDPRLARLSDPWDPAQRRGISVPNDASYYRGRYYLYFGIVPFATLLLPWLKLTGHQLGAPAAMFLFCLAGVWSQLALLWRLGTRPSGRIGLAKFALIAAAVIAGNQILFLCWNPQIFQVEIVASYAFTSAALAAVVFAWQSSRHRYAWMAAASACASLAGGCRPDCIVGAGAFWAVVLALGWRAFARGERTRLILSLSLPMALVFSLLLAYNAARFSSPLEFGFRYQMEDIDHSRSGFLTLGHVIFSLREYLLARPRLSRYFPFILDSADVGISLPHGYAGIDSVYGWLWTVPILWLLPLGFLLKPASGVARATQIAALAAGLANFAVIAGMDSAQYRYAVDALPALELAALVALLPWLGRGAWVLRSALVVLLGWTAVINFGASFTLYAGYRNFDPRSFVHDSFDPVARAFDQPAFLLERIFRSRATAPRLTVQLPRDRRGKEEPLLVTGDYPQQDFVYLYYLDPSHLQVGIEAMGHGGPVSPPIPIDYGRPHVIEILLGSGLPPLGDSFYAGFTPAEAGRLRRRVIVRIDGRTVIDSTARLHPTFDRWRWGESPSDAAFGTRFTGKILGLERVPARKILEGAAGG